jgi:hypothetical protein
MSSKQFNFFITQEDYINIDFFLKNNNILILSDNYIGKSYDSFDLIKYNEENIHQVYLTQKEFINQITISNIEDKFLYYLITSSFILEFSLGGIYSYDNNLLHRGRFYYTKKYYNDNGKMVVKPTDFTNWCDEIIKKFKKHFLEKYIEDRECYYSKSAIEWIKSKNAKLINGGQQWSIKY